MELTSLNTKQREAVTSTEGPVAIIAGAGSGKTKVLTMRVAHLIKNLGVAPFKILGFTFTNKAANEMKVRIANILGGVNANWIGTFHGICLRFLKEEIEVLGREKNFSIIDEEDQKTIISRILQENKFDSKLRPAKIIGSISKIKSLFYKNEFLQNSKNFQKVMEDLDLYSIDDLKTIRFVYPSYCDHLISLNLLDYDDLILFSHKILWENDAIRQKWQKKFDYVMVDEFQDTNLTQFELLNFFVHPQKNNIFVVGDPDQTIYTWRGAYENIFEDFFLAYGNVKKIILDTNYRSTKKILHGSNNLISKNLNRIDKKLITENEDGDEILICDSQSQRNEAEFVASKIKEIIQEEKIKYSDIAILYRSNYLSRYIEEGMILNSIPYKIFGGIKFYQRAEIKDLMAYLKLCNNINDDLSLKRIINIPKRSIGSQTIESIERHASESGKSFNASFLECSTNQNLPWSKNAAVRLANFLIRIRENNAEKTSEIIEKIIKGVDFDNHLKTQENYEARKENIDELINNIKNYEKNNPEGTLSDYLQEISLYTEPSEGIDFKTNSVSLMTIHAAKGTEYHTVFMVAVNEGIFPNTRLSSLDLSEERRVAYVGMTRAMKKLFLTYSNDYSYILNGTLIPSRFIKECGGEKIFSIGNKISSNVGYSQNLKNTYSGNGVALGDSVIHPTFGTGIVVHINGQFADIEFEPPFGNKTLIKNHISLKKINN